MRTPNNKMSASSVSNGGGDSGGAVADTSSSRPENYQINSKVCRLVERYPCMYDRSHQHYLKKDVVDKAWVKIAKEMNDSIPSCKERWRNIRTSFARSINVNKVPSSANRTKPYYLHEELKFLTRHITPGIPISRRSVPFSLDEKTEVIEVAVGHGSFDGFALMHRDEQEEEDDSSQDRKSSSVDECSESIKSQQTAAESQHTNPDEHAVKSTPEPEIEPEAVYIVPPKKRQRVSDIALNSAPLPTLAQPIEVERDIEAGSRGECELEREGQCDYEREREREREHERDVKPNQQHFNQPTHDADFDAIFLQGLLPELKAMDFRQKIMFKRRIYEVIGEVFESGPSTRVQSAVLNSTMRNGAQVTSPPATATATIGIGAPTMTLVNAADLAMIRRLNSVLQSPTITAATMNGSMGTPISSTVARNVVSISSSNACATTPSTPTVTVQRGALTRSGANLLRVTMVNAPATSSTSTPLPVVASRVVKQEPEVSDDPVVSIIADNS